MTESIQKKSYDKINDILYIHLSNDRGYSYADEGPKGIEILRDMETDEITGYMVYYPVRDKAERQKELLELGCDINLNEI